MKVCKLILIILILAGWSCQDQTVSENPTGGEDPTEVVDDPTESEDPTDVIEGPMEVVEDPTEDEDPTEGEMSYLVGTKWKLEGIMNAETNTLKVLEPKDRDDCYTLTFDTDTTAQGKSVANIVFLVSLDPIQIQCWTYVGECFGENECNVYCEALRFVKSYEFSENELKMYFNDNQDYLLFKQIEL